MSSLGLSEYPALSPLEPEHPAIPKSAARAFLISLVLPGMGQVYAKRETAGWATCVVFFLSLLIGINAAQNGQPTVAGLPLVIAICLYLFGFLDAYFSALEYNQGISTYLIGCNPRIAAVLNFLTNGIGYFYLGDRGKGIVMFLVMGAVSQVLQQVLGRHLWFGYLWILLQTAFAIDAYRIARKRLLESFPQLAQHSWRSAGTGQLTPAIPISLAIVLVIPVLCLTGLGGLARATKSISLSSADVQSTPDGTEVKVKDLGLRLLLPDGWQLTSQAKDPNLRAHQVNGECKIILLRQFSLMSPDGYQKAMDRELSRKPGFSVYGHTTGTFGKLPAAFMRVGVGTRVTEQITTAKVGFIIYTLLGVAESEDDACPAQLDLIRNSFRTTR